MNRHDRGALESLATHWEGNWWSHEGEACIGLAGGWIMVVSQPLAGQ